MSIYFEPENIDQFSELRVSDLGLSEDRKAQILSALGDRLPEGVSAAYVYDRKGYVNFDSISGNRNPAYGREDDGIVVQLTYVLTPAYVGDDREAWEKLRDLGSELKAEADRLRNEEIQAKIDAKLQEVENLRSQLS